MRLLIPSVAVGLVAAGAAWAQSGSSASPDVTQLPVGQIYKDFQFPYYEAGQLKFTLTAMEAKGITINRAETTDLKIDLYTGAKVTTTITSPKADLYVADRKMRTHNTVKIERADMIATSRFCDFDLVEKQYTLRDKVRVTLLHFDPNSATMGRPEGAMGTAAPTPKPAIPAAPVPIGGADSLLETPGSYANTNAAPLPQ